MEGEKRLKGDGEGKGGRERKSRIKIKDGEKRVERD